MENQLQTVNSSAPVREIGVITSEIKDICRQAQSMALMYAVEIGRRLVEAKEVLPHGEWGNWLKNEVEFSERSARNFMQLYKEYGSEQLSFFGASLNRQLVADLPYSKALALLSIPADEREEFAEEVQADKISRSELEDLIKERNASREREQELEQKLASAEIAKAKAEIKAGEADQLRQKADTLETDLSKAKDDVKNLRKKLKEVKENPTIPPEALDKAREELQQAIRKELEESSREAMKEFEDKVAAAEQKAVDAENAKQQAEQDKKQAESSYAELQKKLKLANPKVTVFKTLFENLQETYSKLCVVHAEISEESPEIAKGLSGAIEQLGQMMIGGLKDGN